MPQMSPLFWLSLMFLFTFFYLTLCVLTFFKFTVSFANEVSLVILVKFIFFF